MNKRIKNGFTLIEMSVTMVTLGMVAAFSYPTLYGQIEKNKAQQSMNTMGQVRAAVESCAIANGYHYENCITWSALRMADPSHNSGNTVLNSASDFNYSFSFVSHENTNFTGSTTLDSLNIRDGVEVSFGDDRGSSVSSRDNSVIITATSVATKTTTRSVGNGNGRRVTTTSPIGTVAMNLTSGSGTCSGTGAYQGFC